MRHKHRDKWISCILALALLCQSPVYAEEKQESYPQLTAEDIVRLDEGDAEIVFDDEGKATFIRGRYSPEKVEDAEDAAESLNYVSNLLGLTKGALLFCVYKGIDYTTGYTNYLFLQRDGDVTIVNASIKIYVDPEGYTAALSCSFNPAVGVREESDGSITGKEAEEIVREAFPDETLTIYPEVTTRTGIMEADKVFHAWSVISDNPEMRTGGSDLPYLQHFVSYDGNYLMNLPCATKKDMLLDPDDGLERKAKAMFEGYDSETWTGKVTLHDGSLLELTVPVAKSREDGRYYLMDLDRKMMVADYREVAYGSGDIVISSSPVNGGWKDKELLAMYNIGRVYDYYADHGIDSVDGCGIPLLILSGASEADGTPIDNAFFNGFMEGFGVFAISDINDMVECLDVMGHEFTHGITSYSMGGSYYINDLGAINEAFSDIMGNLCELTYAANDLAHTGGISTGKFDVTATSSYGSTDDPNPATPDWRIGEMSGRTSRDMSNPIRFRQPAFVGDAYYCLPTGPGNSSASGNDYGGVHENSSLLGSIAWDLNMRGLNYEQQYSLWMTAMNMMTPKSDYDDILQALIFARKSYGWDEVVDEWVAESFARRGLLENAHTYSGKWDGISFAQYNAKWLERSNTAEAEGSAKAQGDDVTQALDGLLTGGSTQSGEDDVTKLLDGLLTDRPAQAQADDVADSLGGYLTGGKKAETEDSQGGYLTRGKNAETEDSQGGDELQAGGSGAEDTAGQAEDVIGQAEDAVGQAENAWLAGVGLDSDGRITREGFGRIDFDIAAEDKEFVAGVAVFEPYTYATIGVNCPDEEGHVSFLLPEGTYWLSLCVSRLGPNQLEYWPYTTAGGYEPMGNFTLLAGVEVKAGQSTILPVADL